MFKPSGKPRSIYDSLYPLVRVTKIFGMISIQREGGVFKYSFFNRSRIISGIFIISYYSYFITSLLKRPLLYSHLLVANMGCDITHILVPLFTDKKLLKVLNMIYMFDKKFEIQLKEQILQLRTGLKSSFLVWFVSIVIYIMASIDQVKATKKISVFTLLSYYTIAKPVVTVVWFATVMYEITRRFIHLKLEFVKVLSVLDKECNAKSLESARILHANLFEISRKFVQCYGPRLIGVFAHFFVYYLIDFFLYLYIIREISPGLMLLISSKGILLGIVFWASRNVVSKSNEIVEILAMSETNNLCDSCRLQIELCQAQMACQPLRIVASNMFEIDAGFISSMVSVLLTYMIVLMQLSTPILNYYEVPNAT